MSKEQFTFICLFTTGRSGTAFLSQVFGHKKWHKNQVCFPSHKYVVTHESWRWPIKELKKYYAIEAKAIAIQLEALKEWVVWTQEQHSSCIGGFVTDHKVGRYFGYSLPKLSHDYKIIYLMRDKRDAVESFIARWNNVQKSNPDNFSRYTNDLWTKSLYHPSDRDTICNVTLEQWQKYSMEKKVAWYWDEVASRWKNLKLHLSPGNYLEISFEELNERAGLDKLSNFVKIPYLDELRRVRVNGRIKDHITEKRQLD